MALPNFNFGAGEWEVEFWLKTSAAQYGTLIGNAVPWGNGSRYLGSSADGRIQIGAYSPIWSIETAAGVIVLGRPHLVTVNKIGATLRVFVDGALSGAVTDANTWNWADGGGVSFGRAMDGGQHYLSGSMHDLKVRTEPLRTGPFAVPVAPPWHAFLGRSAPEVITASMPAIEVLAAGGTLAFSEGYYRQTDAAHIAPLGMQVMSPISGLDMRQIRPTSGVVSDRVMFKASPTSPETPFAGARVWLLRLTDGRNVWEGWSDAGGYYTATGLELGVDYIAVGIDPNRNHKATGAGPVRAVEAA